MQKFNLKWNGVQKSYLSVHENKYSNIVFMQLLNILYKLAQSYYTSKNVTSDVDAIFSLQLCEIWGAELSHAFIAMIRNVLHVYLLKHLLQHVHYVVTWPC